MKYIEKGNPLEEFDKFVESKPVNWDSMSGELKHKCANHIRHEEQQNLGGYTEKPLDDNDDLHIDHFKKKALNWAKDVTFDWRNLIVEEHTPNYGADYKDRRTTDTADYEHLINPVEEHPELYFGYDRTGQMIIREDCPDKEKASFTIDRFNLNHALLRQMRGDLIRMIDSYGGQLDAETLKDCLKGNGFPTVVDWMLQEQ